MRSLIAAIVALGVGLSSADAAPLDELVEARNAFRDGDFSGAIPMLSKLLYPQARLAEREELAEAHLLLGVAYFETGDSAAAQVEFEQALLLGPRLGHGALG